jgi:hypothetical protein
MTRVLLLACLCVAQVGAQQWPHYAADQAASHCSPLDQITAANVGRLSIAWEWKPNEKVLPRAVWCIIATGRGKDTALVAFRLE